VGRSARSQAVAYSRVLARVRLRRHSATANEYCPSSSAVARHTNVLKMLDESNATWNEAESHRYQATDAQSKLESGKKQVAVPQMRPLTTGRLRKFAALRCPVRKKTSLLVRSSLSTALVAGLFSRAMLLSDQVLEQ
jgi:hypothetical protein